MLLGRVIFVLTFFFWLGGCACLAYPVLRPKPRIDTSPAAFARLRYGMTRAEVEAALGGPPGHYGSDPGGQPMVKSMPKCFAPGRSPKFSADHNWLSDAGWIGVDYDAADRVSRLEWNAVMAPRPWAIRNVDLLLWSSFGLGWAVAWARLLFLRGNVGADADTDSTDPP